MTLLSYASSAQQALTRSVPGANVYTDSGTKYKITMRNESAANWTFFVYQKQPEPIANVFSLAWFASPYPIFKGYQMSFEWEITYNFVWSHTGLLQPGVVFEASGIDPADLVRQNSTVFSSLPGPNFSSPQPEQPSGSLIIKDSSNVPNNTFSVGIGMSGVGTYAIQAGPNLTHTFTPTPTYWIAAGNNVRIGEVLNITTITNTEQVKFPVNVYSRIATLDENNNWSVKDG